MADMTFQPGTVLANKYRLGAILGVGGMGTVYQAEHLALKAAVAIKVIDREVSEGDVALARFMREAQAAASLRSPHVVQILDYGTEGDRPYMVMEMLEGEPLSDRIKRLGRLTPGETFRVINHIAKAVSKAHEQDIIHRDLKPDNVFLVHNEGDEIAKVLDFGVAKVEATQLDGAGHTRTGSLLGTPYYMSPEQAQGNKDIDARSDLWALGVIAFECLTGTRPFSSDGLGDLVLQICIRDIPIPSTYVPVPPGFDAWFKKACEREPVDRFQTARELAEALHDALNLRTEAGGSIPESRWSAAARPSQVFPASQASPASFAATKHDGDETTQRDRRVTTPLLQDLAPDAPGLGTLDGEEHARRGSKWEVVPRSRNTEHSITGEPAPGPGFATFDGSPSDLEMTLPQNRSAGSLMFTAFVALLIGGVVVFGARQAGFLQDDSDSPVLRKKSASQIPAAKPQDGKNSDGTPKVGAPGATQTGKNGTELGTSPDQGSALDPATHDGQTEPGKDGADGSTEKDGAPKEGSEPTGTESTEDPLSAIEQEAQDKLEERKKAGQTETPTKPPEGRENLPQPSVPEGLAPAPAPPPAPK